MPRYEYKVVPAPVKGQKAKGIKTAEGRFALSVEAVLNEMAASGWTYQRAELLPSEERSGLTGSTTNWRNVLVFRRALEDEVVPVVPVRDAPVAEAPPVVRAPPVLVHEPVATPPLASGVDAEMQKAETEAPPQTRD